MLNKLFIVCTSVAVLLCSTAFSDEISAILPVDKSAIKTERFVSEKGDYSINFPSQWAVMKGIVGTDVMVLAPILDEEDLFRENINIISAVLGSPISKEEYYSFNLDSLTQILADFDLEDSEDVKLKGVDARLIIFTHTMGVVNAKVMQYLILDGDRAYVLTFTSDPLDFDKYRPEFEKIAKSFRLENKG